MPIVVKVLKIIIRVFMYISYSATLALLLLTVFDVVRRLIFGVTLTGVPEWSQMFLIISMTAMAHTIVEGKFVVVGSLVELFPRKINIALEVFMGGASLAFLALVGWQLLNLIDMLIRSRRAYFIIRIPMWPMYAVLGVSFLAAALATIVYVYERVLKTKSSALSSQDRLEKIERGAK